MPRRLLLLGGGPTHARVLAAFAREPLAGAELALLTPDARLVQPALLPDFVAGRVAAADCGIDTAALAAAAGAAWVRGRVAAFDAATRTVTLADGHAFDADLVCIDEPAACDRDAVPGAREHALPLHPAEPFVALFDGLAGLARERPLDVVVVGGDDRALELALALAERLGTAAGPAGPSRIALVTGQGVAAGTAPALPADAPAAARRVLAEALARARITVFHEACAGLRAGAAVLASGARLACDAALGATPPRPPAWLAASGLALLDDGAPALAAPLHSVSHPAVFAPGAAGERAAAALAAQLRRAVAGAPLPAVAARPSALRWLRCGRGRALLAIGPVVVTGLAMGALCRHLDRRRVPRLPAVPAPAAGATRPAGS